MNFFMMIRFVFESCSLNLQQLYLLDDLNIGAGSMVLSHVNDAGFWLYKGYFGVSVKNSLRFWTIMETILAVVGLVGVLLL